LIAGPSPLAAVTRLAALFLAVLTLLAGEGSLRVVRAGDGQFEPLSITTKTGRHEFLVEVMRNDDERARGMMYRRSLAPDRGMLFQFDTEALQTFWMENTYVSLDMIFIRADGRVHRIERAAEPLSTRTISSGAPVSAVLEVVAGTADRLGIVPGDKVEHAMFRK
jgi:uncharacterized membrane protein (UPF0127 family)